MSEIEKLKKQFQKISGDRKGPLQGGAEIAINIKNGEIKIEIVSIIEDLKTDTDYYLAEATKEKDPISQKRNIRAAVLTFNAYVEASINQLYSAILHDQGLEKDVIIEKIRKDHFKTKCKVIENKCIPKSSLSNNERKKLRDIRNELVHFKTGHLALWRKLSLDSFEKLYLRHIDWLKELRTHLNVKDPDSENLLSTMRLFYSAFGISTRTTNKNEL